MSKRTKKYEEQLQALLDEVAGDKKIDLKTYIAFLQEAETLVQASIEAAQDDLKRANE